MTARELFLEELASRVQTLAVQAPALDSLRRSAQVDELPAGKLESFKYTPIESLYDAALADPEPGAVGMDAADAPLAIPDRDRFVLPVSGINIGPDTLPAGLSALGLAESIFDLGGLDSGGLNAGLDVARYPLVHLNTGLVRDGLVVRVAAGKRIAPTLQLDLASAESAACSRVVIILEPGSELRLLEQHYQSVVANRVLEIRLGAGSTLHHTRWQSRSDC